MVEYRGWGEILDEEYAKWNCKRINHWGYESEIIMSKVPIPHVADLEGLKIRTCAPLDRVFVELGAGTVWFPGDELYTGLASGLVDAATYDNPAIVYEMGFHEVSSYWILPSINPCASFVILANMDFWDSLPEMDKALIQNTSIVAGMRHGYQCLYESKEALAKVQEQGLVIQYWNEDDLKAWSEAVLSILPSSPEDPAQAEVIDLMFDYMKWAGYID